MVVAFGPTFVCKEKNLQRTHWVARISLGPTHTPWGPGIHWELTSFVYSDKSPTTNMFRISPQCPTDMPQNDGKQKHR